VQTTSDLHYAIRNAFFRKAQKIFDDPAAFDAADDVFDLNTDGRKNAIEPFVADTQFFAFRLFWGCWVMTPAGS
jgi:hypothetical protein